MANDHLHQSFHDSGVWIVRGGGNVNWRYKLYTPSTLPLQNVAEKLNELAAEGWEVHGMTMGAFLLRRELSVGEAAVEAEKALEEAKS